MWGMIIRTIVMQVTGEFSRQAVRKIMNPQPQEYQKKRISYYKGESQGYRK